MMFKHKLLKIKQEINDHRCVDTIGLVQVRLDKTLRLYLEELEHSYSNLLRRDSLKVLQKISEEE